MSPRFRNLAYGTQKIPVVPKAQKLGQVEF